MRTDLPHLAASVFNTPLLVQAGKLDTILSAVGPRLLAGAELDAVRRASVTSPERRGASMGGRRYFSGGGYMADDGIAVLPIYGTLIRRGTWLDSASGLTSYGALTDAVTEIMSDGQVRGLMMECDTPGGEAGGVFDLARFIRRASKEAGKPVWAHSNELAASAGYALASAAERIWVSTTGEVGSIGVVAAHIDMSKADEKAGLKWTYVYAGDRKVEGNPHEPLGKAARSEIQSDVDDLYGMFVDLVASHRSMAAERVRETQARIYRGAKSVQVGLADEVGTFEEAVSAFAGHLDDDGDGRSSTRSSASAWRGAHAQRSAPPPQSSSPAITPAPTASAQSLDLWRRAAAKGQPRSRK